MISVRVEGGTGAGVRKPLRPPAPDWACPVCQHMKPGYLLRCLDCGTPRPPP